ncbi:MAG: sulfotransferase domain-containing protein [Parcubacteria group bacterium]|nr:sulfotransferase domain-containing protein [Parcubacteria group bacterium]
MRPDFLIVGMERSGTHWVAGLLNAHPDIAAFPSLPFREEEGGNKIGEVHFFDTLRSLDGDKPEKFTRPVSDWLIKYNKVFADLVPQKDQVSKKVFHAMALHRYSDYCNSQRGNKKIVGEGSPAYIFHLDFIDSLYPDVPKICSIRDPKDKIVSWYFNKMVRKGDATKPHISKEFALQYLKERIIKEYEALLNYKGNIHCITYEKMSKKTADTARGMVEYLGLHVTDDELSHMIEDAAFEKQTEREGGQKRIRGEENPKSGLRKGIVGDFKNYLSSDVVDIIDNHVGDLRKAVFEKYQVQY